MHVLFSNKLYTSMLLTIDCNTDLLLCALIQTGTSRYVCSDHKYALLYTASQMAK